MDDPIHAKESVANECHGGNGLGEYTMLTNKNGKRYTRKFATTGVHPFDEVEWENRSTAITADTGKVIFEQHDVEVPKDWSQLATNIVVSKYFNGDIDTPGRETSVKQLIERVTRTISDWGMKDGYFDTKESAEAFYSDLTYLMLHQMACFNSPVWFNLGVIDDPQCAACLINSVEDSMESILELTKTEGMLFKHGSGAGSNLSPIRSSKESLSGGGRASGPVSFMKGYDAVAGSVKSGGKCLAPHQYIYTANGPVTVKELADLGKPFIVLSYDPPAGRFKAKTAHAWQSGNKQILHIKTDKGAFFLSPDHPVRLSDNTIILSGNLVPEMSLFACSVHENFVSEVSISKHLVVSVENIGMLPVYDVEVDCPTIDDKTPESGHNFVIWPSNNLSGSGIVVSNTRRSAKIQILDVDHPDIMEFIKCKAIEEKKAWALIEQGYDGGFNVPGGAYDSVFFQNSNLSVRVTDTFMKAAENEDDWDLIAINNTDSDGHKKILETVKARSVLNEIANGTHICGDPGLQFHDTINHWNTCLDTEEIVASNPCSEFVFLNDTACNLASLNLLKFKKVDKKFNVEKFKNAVHIMITAMDILVDRSSYPTEKITQNSHNYRPLGLGYSNLGALLMSEGIPYDSDKGRAWAAAITAIMHGTAYVTSTQLAQNIGKFTHFDANRESFIKVLSQHNAAALKIDDLAPKNLRDEAVLQNKKALQRVKLYGTRNAQVTVLAPVGTIGFMMDCDTTGIEPDVALVKHKKLSEGGDLTLINHTIPAALYKLGYVDNEIAAIKKYIEDNSMIEGAPYIKSEHLPVFDCALKPAHGTRSIHYLGHILMLAAVQPFLSGSVSKTVNVPKSITVEEIEDIYLTAWKKGVKCIAIYRDGSKKTQPINTTRMDKTVDNKTKSLVPVRYRLPNNRPAITHKFSIAGHEGYLTVGMYESGKPGEIFIRMAKEGSTISGLMDAFATSVSIMFQYGIPLSTMVEKFSYAHFEPSGITSNPQIPIAKSLTDYVFRWLALAFSGDMPEVKLPNIPTESKNVEKTSDDGYVMASDAPPCTACGNIMVRNGSCYKCGVCGSTSGCS